MLNSMVAPNVNVTGFVDARGADAPRESDDGLAADGVAFLNSTLVPETCEHAQACAGTANVHTRTRTYTQFSLEKRAKANPSRFSTANAHTYTHTNSWGTCRQRLHPRGQSVRGSNAERPPQLWRRPLLAQSHHRPSQRLRRRFTKNLSLGDASPNANT